MLPGSSPTPSNLHHLPVSPGLMGTRRRIKHVVFIEIGRLTRLS